MRLYKKEKHWSDYWEVHVNFPWIGIRNKLGTWERTATGQEYGFSFPTQCYLYVEDEFYWFFTLKFLGFGVTIIRQNGY